MNSNLYEQEVKLLKKVGEKSISGAITTNYDLFLENCFEGYECYVGQESYYFPSLKESVKFTKYMVHVISPIQSLSTKKIMKDLKVKMPI